MSAYRTKIRSRPSYGSRVRPWIGVVAIPLALACEARHEPASAGTSIAATRALLSPSGSIDDLVALADVPPISASSNWLPLLPRESTSDPGKWFGDGGKGPLNSVWIRVCWARSAQYSRTVDGKRLPVVPGAAQAIQWVREAVGATWMHYANIDFFHWDRMARWLYCTDEREGNRIVLGFSDSNFADQGQSDNAPTRILFDGKMTTRAQYMRAAYNLFGRALNVLPSSTDALAPTTPEGIYEAQKDYGLRRSGALMEWGGQCVRDSVGENSQEGGTIDRIDCRSYSDRTWRPMRLADGESTSLGTSPSSGGERCIRRFPDIDNPVTTGNCDAAYPVDFLRVKWKATGNLCVAASSAAENASLELQDCDVAPALSRWDFEFLDPAHIILAGAVPCLAVTPVAAVEGSALTLMTCDKVFMRPDFATEAQLRFADGLYAAVEDDQHQPMEGKKLILRSYAHLGPVSKYYVSARITSGGRCATAPSSPLGNVDWCVESRDCALSPTSAVDAEPDPLEWDYHW